MSDFLASVITAFVIMTWWRVDDAATYLKEIRDLLRKNKGE